MPKLTFCSLAADFGFENGDAASFLAGAAKIYAEFPQLSTSRLSPLICLSWGCEFLNKCKLCWLHLLPTNDVGYQNASLSIVGFISNHRTLAHPVYSFEQFIVVWLNMG